MSGLSPKKSLAPHPGQDLEVQLIAAVKADPVASPQYVTLLLQKIVVVGDKLTKIIYESFLLC